MTESVENHAASFLGLCMRAGRLVIGQSACVELIRQNGAALVLLDAGASENTRKRIADGCHSHGAPAYALSAGTLGHAIGRRGCMVTALGPGGMADKLLALLNGEERL
ncbi:MAG: ribosomal L7Ae/L30e/S12e/Gadd45 family protein [Clostridiales bacterium]|nr:ribosomal L7Ae/L30e/S12e/Gadd45 family protein [Clostridiales bacterium]